MAVLPTGDLTGLPSVILCLQNWSVFIDQYFCSRPSVQPITAASTLALAWQVIQLNTTAGDVTVMFESATPSNKGALIWVTVIVGSNYALIGGLLYSHSTWCSTGSAWVQVSGASGTVP